MCEDALLAGVLEPTNEPYAIAEIAGIKMCESYNRQYGRDSRSVMPSNLYGAHDNFHVIPTGRKIIVDAYGGGAFSGKDPTTVDCSAAYASRYLRQEHCGSRIGRKVVFGYVSGDLL